MNDPKFLKTGVAGCFAISIHIASVVNQVRFVMARDALSQQNVDSTQKQLLWEQIQKLAESEIELARDLFFVASKDSRIGYEASNHYFYVPLDLVEKVINCVHVKQKFNQEAPAEHEISDAN